MTDLPTRAFLALRQRFFDERRQPIPFELRDKRNTQDDPFDEYLAHKVFPELGDVACRPAPGPLITPDMVLHRPNVDCPDDLSQIVGVEVKKLERTERGGVARSSGLDFNTTPPCGRIVVYDVEGKPVEIRGFYLFVCLERAARSWSRVIVSALALVDGNVLNEDFDLYLSIIGERTKRIGLGTYGDGADRARPMLIFGNPLGIAELDRAATLVHSNSKLADSSSGLVLAHLLRRSMKDGHHRVFSCYQDVRDLQSKPVTTLMDPFRTPARDSRTRRRGRFILPFKIG